MPDRSSDVRKKLDDLYHKTEDIRRNLIEVHHMLTNSGFFDPPKPQYETQPVPVQPHYVPLVVQPVQQVYTPPPPKPQPPPVVQTQTPKPTQAPKKETSGGNNDLEKFIGERLITFIGIAILVIGIAFFVKFAIDKNWINEAGRTAIGILSGGILVSVAHRMRKSYTAFSSVLAGGGIATLYFTITYAFQVYHLFSQPATLGILVVITLFTVLLSVAYDRKELAILAIVGGFASPLMVKTGEGNFVVLCTYMLILDIGMLVLAYYKKWNVITILSFALTILFYTGALMKDVDIDQHTHDHEAFLFATLFYLTFFTMNIINNVKAKRKFAAFEILSLLTNTGLYYAAGYFLLHHMGMHSMKGLFTLLVASFNCVFAFLLFRRQEVDRNLVYFLVGLVITFVSLAGPVQLEGNHITLFWAAESALLLWFYYRSRLVVVSTFSILLNAALIVSTIYNWMMVYSMNADTSVFVNKGFITTIGAVISLGISSILLLRSDEKIFAGIFGREAYRNTLSTFAVLILFIGGLLEMTEVLTRTYAIGIMPIYWAAYIVLFLAAMRFVMAPLKLEFLSWSTRFLTVVLMFTAIAFPHLTVANVRDNWLMGAANSVAPFMMHYVYVAGILFLGFALLRDYMKNASMPDDYRNLYMWLLTGLVVFVLSSELDHSMVMSLTLHPENPAWRADTVPVHIDHALNLSHKVGFPIIWGLCSFLMMIIGMRRKVRPVRIISLVIMGGVVIKLALLGFFGESQSGKIVAFVLCGLILLTVSFMYQKLRRLLVNDEKQNPLSDEKVA